MKTNNYTQIVKTKQTTIDPFYKLKMTTKGVVVACFTE
jgi:hypothetical protein